MTTNKEMPTTMHVEMKNYKRITGHDGMGFEASLYLNGKREAVVVDHANGGEFMYHPVSKSSMKKIRMFQKMCQSLPPYQSQYGELPMNADLWIENNLIQKADAKSTANGKLVFYDPVSNNVFNTTWKWANAKKDLDEVKRWFASQDYPLAEIINGNPVDAIITLD